MSGQDTIAVIGAGVIGAAVAWALAREGRRVLVLDSAEPGVAGASFGNAGHIAAELVQPLPSPGLLCGFWRDLDCFGGALDLPVRRAAHAQSADGPWFEDSAHVRDPLESVRALTAAAAAHSAGFRRMDVRALRPHGEKIEVQSDEPALLVDAAVVCAGMGTQPLLAPFGLRAPLQAVRGYHVEIPGHAPFLDAPVLYTREHVIVTPMLGRLRASSYMEFAPLDAPPDARKPARLWHRLRALGELIADLVAQRSARIPVAAFDLRRFGTHER
jgi:glycine/D-amino acid oxidase-like deaminating enzyme